MKNFRMSTLSLPWFLCLGFACAVTAQQNRPAPAAHGAAALPGGLIEAPAHFGDPHPPLFFREGWKQVPGGGEHPITQDAVTNPNLELKLYGDPKDMLLNGAAQNKDNPIRIWTGTCETPCALALRDKNNYVDLTGLAKIQWGTRVSGFHRLRPIVKLASGVWLVGNHEDGEISDYHETEFSISDVRWLRLDIDKVVAKGSWLVNPDLSKVDEVGFVDVIPGSGHGQGGYSVLTTFAVYGKPVPREPGAENSSNH